MKFKILIILAVVISIASFIVGCSAPASAVCPPMGTVTTIDNPETPCKVNNLIDTNMPNFNWDAVDCKNLQTLPKSSSLSQFIGKPIMLVFHKTMNCPGCKQQMPFIKAAYENWKDSGFTILTIYRGDKAQDMKGYVLSNELCFTALADPDDKVASKLGFAIGAPMSVFVDTKGIIKKYQIGPLQSQEEIENILKSL